MLKKVTVALLAGTLIAAPVFAQSTAPAPRAPATNPTNVPAAKPNINTAKPATAKAAKVKKVTKHKVKKAKVVKRAKHLKHAKPAAPATTGQGGVNATTKPKMPSTKN